MESFAKSPKSFGIDAMLQYAGSSVQLFSGMMFYIFIARLFPPEGVGAIALFMAIVNLFNVIFSLGLGKAAQHFTSFGIGRGDFSSVRDTINRILRYGFLLSVVGFATLFSFSPAISSVFFHSNHYTGLIRLLSVVLLGNVLFGILNGTLLGMQNFRLSAVLNIAIWVVYYFGALLLVIYGKSLIYIIIGWSIGITIGVFMEIIAVSASLRKYKGLGKATASTHILGYSFPIFLSGLITYGATSVDKFIVSGFLTLFSMGIYNFSLLISSSIGFIITPFNNILLPKFSELYGTGQLDRIREISSLSSVLLSYFFVPVALGIAALAPLVLIILGGPRYLPAVLPLRIILFVSTLFVSENVLALIIASVKRTRLFLYSSLCGLLSNVAISYILVPRYGLPGAAFGLSSVYIVIFSVLYFFTGREEYVSLGIRGQTKVWSSGVAMFLVLIALMGLSGNNLLFIPFYVLAGMLIYISLTKALRVFGRNQSDQIRLLLSSRLPFVNKLLDFLVS